MSIKLPPGFTEVTYEVGEWVMAMEGDNTSRWLPANVIRKLLYDNNIPYRVQFVNGYTTWRTAGRVRKITEDEWPLVVAAQLLA